MWKDIPRKDFLYYVVNRLSSALYSYFYSSNAVNLGIYTNMKKNGDINFILYEYPVDDAVKRKPRPVSCTSFSSAVSSIIDEATYDFIDGNLGNNVYFIGCDSRYRYKIYFVEKKDLKPSFIKRTRESLKSYRAGKIKTSMNQLFERRFMQWAENKCKIKRNNLW